MQERILAVFQPQRWDDSNVAISIAEPVRVDITQRVINMEASAVRHIRDDDCTSDDLVDSHALGHDGPYYVLAEEPVAAFFGVTDVRNITDEIFWTRKIKYRAEHPDEVAVPRMPVASVLEVTMTDFFDYETPDSLKEWDWIKDRAKFVNTGNNRESGVFEVMVYATKGTADEAPPTLRPFFEQALVRECPWVLFAQ